MNDTAGEGGGCGDVWHIGTTESSDCDDDVRGMEENGSTVAYHYARPLAGLRVVVRDGLDGGVGPND